MAKLLSDFIQYIRYVLGYGGLSEPQKPIPQSDPTVNGDPSDLPEYPDSTHIHFGTTTDSAGPALYLFDESSRKRFESWADHMLEFYKSGKEDFSDSYAIMIRSFEADTGQKMPEQLRNYINERRW